MGSRTPSTPKPGTERIRRKKEAPRELNVRLEQRTGKRRTEHFGHATLTDTMFRFRTGRTGDQGADFFVHLAYDELASVALDASGASLTLTTTDGTVYRVHVGKHAPAWKDYLKPPAGQLALFGLKPGMRVALYPLPDAALADEIEACVPGAGAVPDETTGLEMIFFGAERREDLRALATQARRLDPRGILWVVYPTSSRGLTEEQVVKAGAAAGLHSGTAVVLSRHHEAVKLFRAS